jgi:hypothetical protein
VQRIGNARKVLCEELTASLQRNVSILGLRLGVVAHNWRSEEETKKVERVLVDEKKKRGIGKFCLVGERSLRWSASSLSFVDLLKITWKKIGECLSALVRR